MDEEELNVEVIPDKPPEAFVVKSPHDEALELARSLEDSEHLQDVESRGGWWIAVYDNDVSDRIVAPAPTE